MGRLWKIGFVVKLDDEMTRKTKRPRCKWGGKRKAVVGKHNLGNTVLVAWSS
jgi:hypothetical protein